MKEYVAIGNDVVGGKIPAHLLRAFREDPWAVARHNEVSHERAAKLSTALDGANACWGVLPDGSIYEYFRGTLLVHNTSGDRQAFYCVGTLLPRRYWHDELEFTEVAPKGVTIRNVGAVMRRGPYVEVKVLDHVNGIVFMRLTDVQKVLDVYQHTAQEAPGDDVQSMCVGDDRLVYSARLQRVMRLTDGRMWTYEGSLMSAASTGDFLVATLAIEGSHAVVRSANHLMVPRLAPRAETTFSDATGMVTTVLNGLNTVLQCVDGEVYVTKFPAGKRGNRSDRWVLAAYKGNDWGRYVKDVRPNEQWCPPFVVNKDEEGNYTLDEHHFAWQACPFIGRVNGVSCVELCFESGLRCLAVATPAAGKCNVSGVWSAVDRTQIVRHQKVFFVPVQDPESRRWYVTDSNNVRYGKTYREIYGLHIEDGNVVFWGRDGTVVFKITTQIV